MDFGLGDIFEKIEERLGSFVANAILVALVFLVFAFVGDAIFTMYITGKATWEAGGDEAVFGLFKYLFSLFLLIFLFYISMIILSKHYQNKIKSDADLVRKLIKLAEKEKESANESIKMLKEYEDEFHTTIDSLEKEVSILKQQVDDLLVKKQRSD